MISFVDGEVVEKGATRVVIGVGGVGYDILVPTSVVAKLPAVGKTTRLHTRMVVREDSMTLYGFSGVDQRDLFDLLTGVTGVGPKVALAFLSVLRPAAEGEDLYLIPSMLPEVRPSQLQFLWPATKGTPQHRKRANWDVSNVWMVCQVVTNRFSGGVTAWRLCPRVSSDGS